MIHSPIHRPVTEPDIAECVATKQRMWVAEGISVPTGTRRPLFSAHGGGQ